MKKRKFNFKLTDYVEVHIVKIYAIVLVSVLLIAVLVVAGVSFYRYSIYQDELKKPPLYSEEDISEILESPGLTDFIIPESLESGEKGFSPYRDQLKMWTDEMVEHYIIPPEELGVDQISHESRKIIEEKLDEIP